MASDFEPTPAFFMGRSAPPLDDHIWSFEQFNQKGRSVLVSWRLKVDGFEVERDPDYDPVFFAKFEVPGLDPMYKWLDQACDLEHAFEIYAEVVAEAAKVVVKGLRKQALKRALEGKPPVKGILVPPGTNF